LVFVNPDADGVINGAMISNYNISWPKTIAFDADDTLWHNEPYFDEAQEKFCELFSGFASKQELLTLY
jgi:acid phosphatase class B